MAENKKRCSRVTSAQKDSLVDYMLEHKEFARGQFVGLNANHKSADMWESLSLQLNSMGPVVKTVEQWKKCWTDLKSGVRRCCNERKAFMQKTGGGSYREIPRELSEMEDKILQIITTHAVDGDGVTPESGVIVDIPLEKENKENDQEEISEPGPSKVRKIDGFGYRSALEEARLMHSSVEKRLDRIEAKVDSILKILQNVELVKKY